jgi:uncharacterized protein
MTIKGNASLLKIYSGESDRINGRPLYEEIVFEARKAGIAGATVYKGILSYGASHSIHTMKIFALSSDLPIVIEMIDQTENLRTFLPRLNELLDMSKKGGLVIMEPVEVLRYQKGQKYLSH